MSDPIESDQSKTCDDGVLRYAADGSEVFPGATGVRKHQLALPYGCTRGLEPGVTVAWGARMIWPDDLLPDRQGCAGGETGGPERNELLSWLSSTAGAAMRDKARRLAGGWDLSAGSNEIVTLYEDTVGKVVGSPQGSHGYFYVAAWLHEHVAS